MIPPQPYLMGLGVGTGVVPGVGPGEEVVVALPAGCCPSPIVPSLLTIPEGAPGGYTTFDGRVAGFAGSWRVVPFCGLLASLLRI